jgi:hypothetical protein
MLLESLFQNTHIRSFLFDVFDRQSVDTALECITFNQNLIEVFFSSQIDIMKALTYNRRRFQEECRIVLARKLFSLQSSALMERRVMLNILEMSAHDKKLKCSN